MSHLNSTTCAGSSEKNFQQVALTRHLFKVTIQVGPLSHNNLAPPNAFFQSKRSYM